MAVAHELFQSVTLEWVGEGVANMSHLQAGGGGMGGSLYLYFTPQNFLRKISNVSEPLREPLRGHPFCG